MQFALLRLVLIALVTSLVPPVALAQSREDAYRANNLGVALLEQFKYRDGADAFGRAVKADPKLAIARINLAIALFNVPDLAAAEREAKAAIELAPKAPQPHYILGLIARTQNKPEEAIAAFKRVLAVDPGDVGANVNIGQIYAQNRQFAEAAAVFRTAIEAEPYNITAAYNLATALLRTGAKEEGQAMMQRFQALRQSGSGTSIGPNYLEQGRYAEAVASTGAEPELVSKETPKVAFALAADLLPGDGVKATTAVPFDYDGDGDLDLFAADGSRQALLRNDGGKLVDATKGAGFPDTAKGTRGAVAGDVDNDGQPDLFVFGAGARTLFRNLGGGKFGDATTASKLPAIPFDPVSAVLSDVDHDGDVDLFVVGEKVGSGAAPTRTAAAPLLLRNNGDGTFEDVSTASKIGATPLLGAAAVATDYDNRRDVDLLAVGSTGVQLLRNLRDQTFLDVAADVGLGGVAAPATIAAGDVNGDGFTDLFFGSASGTGSFALSDGRGRFAVTAGPGAAANAADTLFVDYDNDGLLDLVAATAGGLRVVRNAGGSWVDVTTVAVPKELQGAPGRLLGAGDLDRDGDTDLIVSGADGRLAVARNDGGNANRSVTVDLTGRVSNRSGIGARVEVRAGSLLSRAEHYSASPAVGPADVVLGIGTRKSVDAVRVLWPSGTVQAETEIASATLEVTELDRKPSSCPFLYVWNGERFEFVTDFMGGGEMGYWHAPGVWSTPDPDEYVRIPHGLLKERDGRYELRVTNELEEVLFVDHLELVAVDHPEGMDVYPNEGLRAAPPEFRLFGIRNARPPVAAVDDRGRDWTASVAELDRDFVKGFETHRIRGYARTHSLEIDIGPYAGAAPLLLLTGWTDYAFSSDNVAAHQAGLALAPPVLQAKTETGEWVTVDEDMGIPVGRPQTLVVDLAGKLPPRSREVRIVTNMRIYWDRVSVAERAERADGVSTQAFEETRLEPEVADLRWRGFSRPWAPDGVEPWTYAYDDVSTASPWKVLAGRYTREGDVRELLASGDDLFVVSRTGDEIALSFDASRLPKLRDGWTRTFLLYSYGYSKEMDPNSASPNRVEPLPFRGMSGYPYPESESYPNTPDRQRVLETYNTRIVTSTVPPIEATVAPR